MDETARALHQKILAHYHLEDVPPRGTLAPRRFLSVDETFAWPDLSCARIADTGTCRGLRDMAAILSDGRVVPCCLDAYGQAVLGNVFETPLIDILRSPQALAIRKGFQEGRHVHPLTKRLHEPDFPDAFAHGKRLRETKQVDQRCLEHVAKERLSIGI